MTEMVDVVVRGFGSEIRHAVRVPAASLHQYEIFGSEFTGIPTAHSDPSSEAAQLTVGTIEDSARMAVALIRALDLADMWSRNYVSRFLAEDLERAIEAAFDA